MGLDRKRLMGIYLAALITITILGILIILVEVDSGVKAFLDSITGHHWLTKSLLIIVLFPLLSAVFYFLFGREGAWRGLEKESIMGWTLAIVAITLIFTFASFLYYALHFLGIL